MYHAPRRPLSRRRLIQIAAAAGGVLALGRQADAQDRNAPASLKRGGTTLQMRAWERYPAADIPGLNRYLDATPGLSVEWVSTPYSRYRDRMIAEFISSAPLDIVQLPESEIAAWADSGWLKPLDGTTGLDKLLAAATPAAREGVKGVDGKVYGLPYLSDAFGFAYDEDTLHKAGFDKPASNLDELKTQMLAVKKAGIDEFPLSLAMKRQPGNFWSLWATVFASGGDLFDADNQPVFDKADNPLKAVLEWYAAALNEWKIVGQEDMQRDWGAARTGIRTGIVKFGYMAQYALAEFNVWPDSKVAGKIKMALVPGLGPQCIATVSYAHSVGIAATTKAPDQAWKLLEYYAGTDKKGQFTLPKERLLGEGGRSPYPALYQDPAVKELVAKMTGGNDSDFQKLSSISRLRQATKTAWYAEWELFMMAQFQEAMMGRTGIADAIKKTADEARRLAKA
ncbi:Multiple sugar transport system substrate-binding protein [Hyphomicrobiales bacterium]|nr:Multiple sugar transport system substrate-binding protein [Hyphomicrobiales bacterium]CAH1694982.1 Multiple sugar transport system substrate-binding protein [Hyphomicrobiales bacterium]